MAELRTDEKVCPFCAETIKAAAVRCRYCHSDLAPDRDAGAAPPAPGTEQPPPAAAAETGPHPAETRVPFLASLRLLKLLVALCLLLGIGVALAWGRAENPPQGESPDGAITSVSARDAGMQAATEITQKVLSYDWRSLDRDMAAARKLMAPSFRAEYGKAMAGVKQQTVKNQVKLTAKPVATSIVSATDRKVEALVFVNQVTTAKGTDNQRLDQNRVLVTLTRDGGEWRVSKMDAF